MMARKKEISTLEEYLEEHGIKKSTGFDDFQDYIEAQQEKVPTRVVRPSSVPVEGSMHLALGRIAPSDGSRTRKS